MLIYREGNIPDELILTLQLSLEISEHVGLDSADFLIVELVDASVVLEVGSLVLPILDHCYLLPLPDHLLLCFLGLEVSLVDLGLSHLVIVTAVIVGVDEGRIIVDQLQESLSFHVICLELLKVTFISLFLPTWLVLSLIF